MNIKELIEKLHPLERRVLPVLQNNITLSQIVGKTNLKDVEVMRALQWLENKKVLRIKKSVREIIQLDKNGERYLKDGFPERIFLNALKNTYRLNEIKNASRLDEDEFNVSLGVLRKIGAIELRVNKIILTDEGKKLLTKKLSEEIFITKLPLDSSKLIDKDVYNELMKRRSIIKTSIEKIWRVELTNLGEELLKEKITDEHIDAVTPSLIKESLWKDKKFRRFDVEINVPKIYPGKRHFVNQAIEYVKRIWLEMGFREMTGPLVQTSFWNFDALFTAQDHPARDLQDTFFIKDPKYGKLNNNAIVERVRKTHENGWSTGSLGWRYVWDKNEAKRNVLRTHTTVLSAKTIAALNHNELPVKFFSIGKCFRNETLDWKHLFEFYQVEGIVVDENANFKHLLGYLKEYYRKLGFDKIRFRPSYFPYTELSVEPEVFHPVKKEWIELGGAGIFRPEVVKPLLGKDIPVLAWGQGLERAILDYYNLKDLRDLYKNDLKLLREMKPWLK